jgi:hypothetical protein
VVLAAKRGGAGPGSRNLGLVTTAVAPARNLRRSPRSSTQRPWEADAHAGGTCHSLRAVQ